MSAFARRKLLLEQEKISSTSANEDNAQTPTTSRHNGTILTQNGVRSSTPLSTRSKFQKTPVTESIDGGSASNSGFNTENEIVHDAEAPFEKLDLDMQDAPTEIQISTFVPDEQNCTKIPATKDAPSRLTIRMRYKETLVLQGEYVIEVTLGSICINGAFVTAPDSLQIFAPSTHSLPSIECQKKSKKRRLDGTTDDLYDAAFTIHNSSSGLHNIENVCPIFNGIWQAGRAGNAGSESYTPMYKSTSPAPILTIPQSWQKVFKDIQNVVEENERNTLEPPIIMASGAKSAGKSTLTRQLLNQLLTKKGFKSPIAFLEIDPGQPTFTAPGVLALHVLQKPVVGPSFTCIKMSTTETIKAHHIGQISPREDPEYYTSCIAELMAHYRTHIAPLGVPLIINTPGWVKGTGRELLQEIVEITKVTDMLALGSPGESSNLLDEILPPDESIRRYIVDANPTSPTTGPKFTPADLRTLQTICYFHLSPPGSPTYCDFSKHITAQSPWIASYYPANIAAVAAVSILDADIPQSLLTTAFTASIVSVELVPRNVLSHIMSTISPETDTSPTGDSMDLASSKNGGPGTQTTHDLIPYLPSSIPLPVTQTQTAGLAIIRDVDIKNREIQLLTPISAETMESWEKDDLAVVLVRGRLEMPVWLLWNGEVEQRWDKQGASFQTQVPYLSFTGTIGDAAKGAKEWRVRRNLMRRGQMGNG